jgi:hypothetical protein
MINPRVKSAKSKAVEILSHHGVHDNFTVKVKNPKGASWVAMYRGGSQFRNSGNGPIFWLSEELLNDSEETVISILHEYGHVIAEFFYKSGKHELIKLIRDNWEGEFCDRLWDEESFAEDFAQYLYRGCLNVEKHVTIDIVINAYVREMNSN